MSEPDDVERLVAAVEAGHERDAKRLARIVRELLAKHPVRECADVVLDSRNLSCLDANRPRRFRCDACWDGVLRERLNKIARGEEA